MSVIAVIEETAKVIQAITAIGEAGAQVVEYVEKVVKQVEADASGSTSDGSSKLETALAYIKAFVEVIGEDWAALQEYVEELVDAFVSTFNYFGIFTHSSDDSDD